MNIMDIAASTDSPEHLSLPPEIWSMVGEMIQSQDTILALITTCRTFLDVFSPFLRRKFGFKLTAVPTFKLRRKALPTGLQNTQEFEVLLEEIEGNKDALGTYHESQNSDYTSLVVRMLKEMTNLKSFRWIDSSFDEPYRLSLMLRDPELLHALKTSSTIKDVSILFASQYLDDPEDAMNCSIPLEGFKNLTSLELYNFFGNPESLIPDLVDALGECPGLKTLGLSSGCDYDCENLPEALLIDDEEDFDFLHKICENYGSRSRLSPLALDTLRLGQGMYIFDSSIMHPVVKNQGKYLPKLVQIETLKNLHLFNGLLKEDIYDDPEPLEVDWSQLEGCKSLQKLSVSIFDEEVLDWLNTSGNSVQDFIVTQHYSMYDKDLDNYKFLCLPQLSMISLREMMVSKRDGDDAWSDTDSSITDFSEPENGSEAETKSRAKISPKSPTLPKAGSPSEAETTLDAESMSELEYPSGARIPYLELDRSTITVLDRLSDHGAQLTRLGICIDLETQWAQFSSHLPQLQRLTQLRLDGKSYCTGQYPTKASSLWPGVETSKDIAYHYAILIHSKCPSLQYINIEYCAWQVLYQKLTNGDMATDFVSLRPLDPDEVVSIELFALGNFRSENGLPMSERSGTPPSDEQLNRAQRYSDELEVARREGKLSPGTEKYLCH